MKLKQNDFLVELNCRKIDLNMTKYLNKEFTFSDVFGTKYSYDNAIDMKTRLELLTKELLCDWNYSQGYWCKGSNSVQNPTVKEEKVVIVTPKEITEVKSEEIPHVKEVDWSWIETLKNTKEDKKAFDEYAEEDYSIKLKRTMSLENMIKDFKEKLGE